MPGNEDNSQQSLLNEYLEAMSGGVRMNNTSIQTRDCDIAFSPADTKYGPLRTADINAVRPNYHHMVSEMQRASTVENPAARQKI